jgi:hypothetical protein
VELLRLVVHEVTAEPEGYMFQLVVCLVTAMDNVFDRMDGCNVIDLRC